jgi:hypothetical protein
MAWERLNNFTADLCASVACNQMGVAAVWRFESGGVGSHYCNECRSRIDENRKRFDAKEGDYLDKSGAYRSERPGFWKST